MQVWAFDIKPKSGFRTLPSGSLLWGSIAWAVYETEGREGLQRWIEAHLDALEAGSAPPLRLSSAFPKGFLPRPVLPPAFVDDTVLRKKLKGIRWLTFKEFDLVLKGGDQALLEKLKHAETNSDGVGWELKSRPRVTINRLTGGAAEGLLFEDHFYTLTTATPEGKATLYALLGSDFSPDHLYGLLSHIGMQGLGGASVGYGLFDVGPPYQANLPTREGPFCILLGPGLLHAGLDGWWKVAPYWGRLGHIYAYAPIPFKRPYLRLLEGSVVRGYRPQLLDVTPSREPEPGVRVYENLAPLCLNSEVPHANEDAA